MLHQRLLLQRVSTVSAYCSSAPRVLASPQSPRVRPRPHCNIIKGGCLSWLQAGGGAHTALLRTPARAAERGGRGCAGGRARAPGAAALSCHAARSCRHPGHRCPRVQLTLRAALEGASSMKLGGSPLVMYLSIERSTVLPQSKQYGNLLAWREGCMQEYNTC